MIPAQPACASARVDEGDPPLGLGGHLLLGGAAGLALGLVSHLLWGEAKADVWLAAAVLALLGVLIAVPVRLSAMVVLWARPAGHPVARLRRALATLRTNDRSPGRRAVASLLAAWLSAASVAVAVALGHGLLETVTERELALVLVGTLCAVATAGALLAFFPLREATARALGAVDRRVRLPLPTRPWPYALVFVCLPGLAGSVALLDWARADLGVFAIGFDLLQLLLFELALLPAIRVLLRCFTGRPWALGAVSGAGLASIVVVFLAPVGPAARLSAAPHAGQTAIRLLRLVTDVDRDGSSGILAGGDCAPFDGAVHPGAADVPADGIDADCDGIDPRPRDAAASTASGALPPEQVRPYDVVVILVDALRADHLGATGHERRATPNLDALAADSFLFTQAYSTASATRVAMSCLVTGRWPTRVPWRGGRTDLADHADTLAERLADLDYHSEAWVNRWVQGRLPGLAQGFAVFRPALSLAEQRDDHAHSGAMLAHRLLRVLDERDPARPLFLYTYFEDPHHPYRTHPEPDVRFGKKVRERYDGELAYADRRVGMILEHLRWGGRWDDTVVVVLGDHGEEFGEHGGWRHARTLYEEALRVPILLRVPGLGLGKIDTPVSLVDIVPTVLELVGLEGDPADIDGRSLLIPALTGADDPERAILAELRGQSNAHHLRSLRRGRWKLIRDLTDSRTMLFDLVADPGEKTDLAETQPDVVEELEQLLAEIGASR